MNNIKEIQLPEYFELDKIENGKIILKKINPIDRLPNTWEECAYNITHDIIKEDFIFFQTINSSKYKEAFEALSKLIILRDCYRMGWKPSTDTKFIMNTPTIFHQKNIGMVVGYSIIGTGVFSFQSEEIRDKFYNNFKDLLEQIKPLFE